jgi:NAD(P)-dependent dehydrogenase (short-subunit alcohol dehydrogenase family)
LSEPLSSAAPAAGSRRTPPSTSLRRIAGADDVVEPIMFLLGADSRSTTGQTLWANGGAYKP